jgi:hypothetical protein
LQKADRLTEAVEAYGAALATLPTDTRAANNMAVALRALGRRDAAEALYRRVLALRPEAASTHVNLGNVLRDLGRLEEAEAAHRQALALEPGTRGALYGMGLVARDRKRLAESVGWLEQVIAQAPDDVDANWDLAQSLLCAGDYRRGFAQYEWRWRLPGIDRPDHGLAEWSGDALAGRRLLLYGEQGFGDVLQFVRFVPLALGADGRAVLQVRHELISLLAGQIPGVEAVVPRGAAATGCAVAAPLLSLPGLLGLDRAAVPTAPYLTVPPRKRPLPLPPRPAGGGRLVGLCWQGSPTQKNDRNRSLPFAALLPLLGLPQVAFVSLQKGPAAADPAAHGLASLVPSLDGALRDFADTAAAIAGLDLVITADTSVLHVAGALGKPVWVLLSVFHDWRFDAEDSIATWYPQARVFKQEQAGDWQGVIGRVKAALAAEAA